MAVRQSKLEELNRLAYKTLDARFSNEIRQGLNCSPFEAEAVGRQQDKHHPHRVGQQQVYELQPGRGQQQHVDRPGGQLHGEQPDEQARQQSVVEVARGTETGEAPGRQGATTENIWNSGTSTTGC